MDWGNLCKAPFYIEARNHVSGVGKIVAKLIESLAEDGGLQLEDLTLIGHSLGAHVAGNAGKNLRLDGKIGRIAGKCKRTVRTVRTVSRKPMRQSR